jgi:hypothetical protein
MTNWVYIRSEPGVFTVGFYDPRGQWHADSDHPTSDEAAQRVHFLNGGRAEDPEPSDTWETYKQIKAEHARRSTGGAA